MSDSGFFDFIRNAIERGREAQTECDRTLQEEAERNRKGEVVGREE